MPKRTSKTGSELFIDDNSDDECKVLRYLRDWGHLSSANRAVRTRAIGLRRNPRSCVHAVQIELKTLGINPRHAMEQLVEYTIDREMLCNEQRRIADVRFSRVG